MIEHFSYFHDSFFYKHGIVILRDLSIIKADKIDGSGIIFFKPKYNCKGFFFCLFLFICFHFFRVKHL